MKRLALILPILLTLSGCVGFSPDGGMDLVRASALREEQAEPAKIAAEGAETTAGDLRGFGMFFSQRARAHRVHAAVRRKIDAAGERQQDRQDEREPLHLWPPCGATARLIASQSPALAGA